MDDIESIYNGYVLILMLIGFIGVIVAFIPTYIAFGRKNPYKWIILIINIFIGWTGIGWLILLIYTLFPKKKNYSRSYFRSYWDHVCKSLWR